MQKLDWSEIEATAAKAKTAQRRLVPISDNLSAWLSPVAQPRGPFAPDLLRKRFDAVKTAGGFKEWPHNAMRHSFGSYRLAACHDAARVSLEMDNSREIVMKHYREVVRPKQVERYWNPPAGEGGERCDNARVKGDCSPSVTALFFVISWGT